MHNLHLNAEQFEFRDTVRDFVAQKVKPFALKSAARGGPIGRRRRINRLCIMTTCRRCSCERDRSNKRGVDSRFALSKVL
jgi:hypothetical protein